MSVCSGNEENNVLFWRKKKLGKPSRERKKGKIGFLSKKNYKRDQRMSEVLYELDEKSVEVDKYKQKYLINLREGREARKQLVLLQREYEKQQSVIRRMKNEKENSRSNPFYDTLLRVPSVESGLNNSWTIYDSLPSKSMTSIISSKAFEANENITCAGILPILCKKSNMKKNLGHIVFNKIFDLCAEPLQDNITREKMFDIVPEDSIRIKIIELAKEKKMYLSYLGHFESLYHSPGKNHEIPRRTFLNGRSASPSSSLEDHIFIEHWKASCRISLKMCNCLLVPIIHGEHTSERQIEIMKYLRGKKTSSCYIIFIHFCQFRKHSSNNFTKKTRSHLQNRNNNNNNGFTIQKYNKVIESEVERINLHQIYGEFEPKGDIFAFRRPPQHHQAEEEGSVRMIRFIRSKEGQKIGFIEKYRRMCHLFVICSSTPSTKSFVSGVNNEIWGNISVIIEKVRCLWKNLSFFQLFKIRGIELGLNEYLKEEVAKKKSKKKYEEVSTKKEEEDDEDEGFNEIRLKHNEDNFDDDDEEEEEEESDLDLGENRPLEEIDELEEFFIEQDEKYSNGNGFAFETLEGFKRNGTMELTPL